MPSNSFRNLCIFHILDGLNEGLSHFSQPSRVALLYAIRPDDPIRIYDPQNLLQGHEPKLEALYLDSDEWRRNIPDGLGMESSGHIYPEQNLQLAGLISFGGRSSSFFYQMWFTEHHPDMCSIGPTECWLEHAVWLLSQDFETRNAFIGTSGYVLQNYSTHAVRDYIVDQRNLMIGADTQLRIYPILDAVLGISKTYEEGAWARGKLLFVEPATLDVEPAQIQFLVRFPYMERPLLKKFKHVRKLLQAVEKSERKLISDGRTIVGIAEGPMPPASVTADFRGGYGFLKLNGDPVCSFSDGSFHSTTHRAKLVQIEEILLESDLHPDAKSELFKIVAELVHHAEEHKFGCTLVIRLSEAPLTISGQHFEEPPDLRCRPFLDLAKSLAEIDGALYIGPDLKLHGFAFLLDGHTVEGEDRSRGARFNSALRFTAEHDDLIVVVVSSDRPVSIIQDGVELTAQCEWKPLSSFLSTPPTLEDYLQATQNGNTAKE